MVAFTDSQLLPYQVGSDRPCDAPGVLCDMATLLDSKINDLDQILNRLEPAIPAAQLQLVTPLSPATTFEPIAFDAVGFDTDDMINFDRSVFDILPNRTGTYLAVGYAAMSGGGIAGSLICLNIGITAFNNSNRADCMRNAGTLNHYLRVTTPFQWTGVSAFTGETLTSGVFLSLQPSTTPFTILNASLTVYWINDRTT